MNDDSVTTGLSGLFLAALAGIGVGLIVAAIVRRLVPESGVAPTLVGIVAGVIAAALVYGATV